MIHIISLGAGVQSSTMALMAAAGELTPMPDCAIFADTQAEPKYVYEWLDWLTKQLPFPVHIVTAGDLRQMTIDSCGPNKDKARFASAPFYVDANGSREGMLRRQCTREFKVAPITKKVRELCGLVPRQRAPKGEILAKQWIGISCDEAQRMKPPREKYIEHIWPLIDIGMYRLDCLEWMKARGYPEPKKSACTFCPYRDDKGWLEMKRHDPSSWVDALVIDQHIRDGATGMRDRNQLYLHRSLQPLGEIDLARTSNDAQIDMFGNECEGMCGV